MQWESDHGTCVRNLSSSVSARILWLPRVKEVLCKQSMDDNSQVGCLLYEYKDFDFWNCLRICDEKKLKFVCLRAKTGKESN